MGSGEVSGASDSGGKGEDVHEYNKNIDDNTTLVLDSSVDYQGNTPSRATTGAWKAAMFIIWMEFSERMSYFGLVTDLIMYLTKVLGQDTTTAAKNVNCWAGVTTMMPLLGGFVSDSYWGGFYTALVSTIIYLTGLILMTLCQFIPALKAPPLPAPRSAMKLHETIFFVSLYFVSTGTGGHKPALESFGADQFDGDFPKERKQKMSYFNWWNASVSGGMIGGVIVFVNIQDKAGWGAAYIFLTAMMGSSLIVFCAGKRVYRYKPVSGRSALTPLVRVMAAAIAKRGLPYPNDPANELHEIRSGNKLLPLTRTLKRLDKAAILDPNGNNDNPWRLATITEVEQLKQVIWLLPVWLTTQTFGLVVAQAATFFVKQASLMDRKAGASFEVPPACVYSLAAIGMIITVAVYDKVLTPIVRRSTGDERGISILQRVGIGMVFSTLCMGVAAIVEGKRLGALPEKIGVWWIFPQYLLLGVGEGFAIVGLQEYFYEAVPSGMRSLGIAFYLSVIGASNFLSSILITVIGSITMKMGSGTWFAKDLNHSRIDNFYCFLAVLNAISLCAFVLVTMRDHQKRRVASVAE